MRQAARKRGEFFSEYKFGKSVIEFFEMLIEKYNLIKKEYLLKNHIFMFKPLIACMILDFSLDSIML